MKTKTKKRAKKSAPVPMEAKLVSALPEGSGWQFEPKWDGFRCIGVRDGADVSLYSKSGKDLGRYFPEIKDLLRAVPVKSFTLDGELCIAIGATLSFEALQMRLHPAASRIAKLSKETPAMFIAFDLLARGVTDLRPSPLQDRRAELEALLARGAPKALRLSPATISSARARRWLGTAGGGWLDGVVAKRLTEPYQPGERAMLKVKCLRTADCVVGGFRYASNKRVVGSLLLGLFNDAGKLDHVGFTSGFPAAARPALTKKLEALRGGEGFTGNAPGGPSRWSTERSTQWEPVRTKLIAEVQYDQVTGLRFRHGTRFLRWRPDKSPRQCTMEQLRREMGPAELARSILAD